MRNEVVLAVLYVNANIKSAQMSGIFWKPYISGVIFKWDVLYTIAKHVLSALQWEKE